MKRLFSTFFVLSTLVSGVLAATPLHAPNDKMAKCCDKAKGKDGSASAKAAMLCCAAYCSDPAPTSGSSSSNITPLNFTVSESIAEQIAALFAKKNTAVPQPARESREILVQTFQPKFIQHNSFLI